MFGVVQPNQKDLRNIMSSVSLIIDLADVMLNASVQLTRDDGSAFECTNNPINDYHTLTKNLNVVSILKKV